MQLSQPCKSVFATRPKNLSPKNEYDRTNWNFSKKTFLIKSYSGRLKCKMQIWQSWGKNFEENLKFPRLETKNYERSEEVSGKVVSSKCSSGHVQCSSDNPAKNNFATRPNNFRPKSENDEKKLILQNTRFLKMLLWTR